MHDGVLPSPRDWAHFSPASLPGVTLLKARFMRHAFERHSHDTYSIGVTTGGVQSFNCRGRRHDSCPGNVILFNPDEPHDGQSGSERGFEYAILYLSPDTLNRLADERVKGSAGRYFRSTVVEDLPAGQEVLRAVKAAGQSQESLRAEILLARLVTTLLSRHADTRPLPAPPSPGHRRMEAVRDYIDAHFSEDLTVAHLAQVAGLSRAHLTRAYTSTFGVPPHVYLNSVRLRHAQWALRQGQPAAAAALAAGFADQSHFTRRFKGAVGLTPAAWARQMAGPGGKGVAASGA
ncbi:AraC family transcriptional regulator [Aquabacterium sp. A7-Y]|uniref:AraC family transcriptional regulator n=1 Tax=Aquabacterium sp. A7-Y TaxID=1349605 RepID=UPI00223D9312|nr:AraC family transcriptional regulator [Aquabacterium sp. A7-Y]MCW7538049.1 AraC family transcriptional regulator [Aquabacterium sp. A7-Y]